MYYDIEFRIVRIRLDNGTYICIATNLSEEKFPLEEINKLYRMRWSEETSFRELKYTIGRRLKYGKGVRIPSVSFVWRLVSVVLI